MSTNLTYTISLRDNIDTTYVTGSAIYPYYPPTSPAFSSSFVNNTYYIEWSDIDTFTGWRSEVTSITYLIEGYTINLYQEQRWKVNNSVLYTINGPKSYSNPVDGDIDTPNIRDYIYVSNLDSDIQAQTVLQAVLTILNKRELRSNTYSEEELLGFTVNPELVKWKPLQAVNATKIREQKQGRAYGFRIKTPGYQDTILFAETTTGLPLKPNQGVVDLGITTITRVVADTTKEVASFSNVNAEEINKATPKDEKEKGIVKLRKVLDTRGLKLKKIIVAAAVPAITQFGISNIKKLLEENDTQEKLQEAVSKLKTLCPTPEKINQLVVLKGRYEQQVVKFYESITTARNTAIPSQRVAEALNTTLQVLSTARSAGNIALAFLPLAPGAATALLNTQKEVEENLGPLLEKITKGLSLITSTFVFIAGILALINKLMTLLDILIRLCSEKLGIPYQSTNIVIAASPNLAPKTQTYKGFTFEIQLNTQQTTPYPKRYAVAKDKFNIIQLKSQESYTPNPDILIEELKFIIDRDNLSGE